MGRGCFALCVAFIIQSMAMSQMCGILQEMYSVEQKLLECTSKVRHQYIIKQSLVMRSIKYHTLLEKNKEDELRDVEDGC